MIYPVSSFYLNDTGYLSGKPYMDSDCPLRVFKRRICSCAVNQACAHACEGVELQKAV